MVLDLDIVLFAKSHKAFGEDKREGVPSFGRKRVGVTPLTRTTPIDQIAKHMRYTAYKKARAAQQAGADALEPKAFCAKRDVES